MIILLSLASNRLASNPPPPLFKAQSRRVYEILRLHHTNLNIPSEKESFKEMLMKRLKKSVMDPKRDGGRLSRVLQNDQHSLVIAMHALEPVNHNCRLNFKIFFQKKNRINKVNSSRQCMRTRWKVMGWCYHGWSAMKRTLSDATYLFWQFFMEWSIILY